MMANVMASFSQFERRLIGERTSAALQAAKAYGQRLGRPRQLSQRLDCAGSAARGRVESDAALWALFRPSPALQTPRLREGSSRRSRRRSLPHRRSAGAMILPAGESRATFPLDFHHSR